MRPQSVAHGTRTKAGRLLGIVSRPAVIGMTAFALVFVAATAGHQLLDSVLVRIDQTTIVHQDRSSFGTRADSQVRSTLRLAYRNQNGDVIRVLVDEPAFSAFAAETFARLDRVKRDALNRIPGHVNAALGPSRQQADSRVTRYADWYFAWGTGYAIMGEAAKSLANHATAAEITYVKDHVAHDVGRYIGQHYQEIVLYPEKSDAEIQRAYQAAYRAAHQEYLAALTDLDVRFQAFVQRATTHAAPQASAPAAELDWGSQIAKLRLSTHERGDVVEAARTGLLATGGAVVGSKAATVVAAKAVSGKAVAAAGEQLALKLASPFVSKALTAGASAVGGAAAGALAGPVGAAVGLGVGVVADYAVNKGVELAKREDFERDAREAVAATFTDWHAAMAEAIRMDAEVWFEDTIQLLGSYRGPSLKG